jgi:glycosyltransferase involved in cell wall biosynthesis
VGQESQGVGHYPETMSTGPTKGTALPSVSVALCSRNGAAYIETQLRSILAQTLLPGEIIVSDDASSDGTRDIVRAIAAEAAGRLRVALIENERPLGVTGNFEQAVRACGGELIALCDQDDVWHPDRLARLVPLFVADDDLLLAFGDARLVDATGADLGRGLFESLELGALERAQVARGDAFRAFTRRNLATGATVLLHRRLLDYALPFPPQWVHDEWLAIIAAGVGKVTLVEEPLVDYRQHGANEIGVEAPTLRYKFRRVVEARSGRNARLAERARVLVARLEQLGTVVDPSVVRFAEGKAEAEAFRAALPSPRILRIVPVLRAAARGWYTSFASQGRKDMLRDLLQPHDD